METVFIIIGILALMLLISGVLYLLYKNGIAVTKSIAAVKFVFHRTKNGDKAALNSCNGWLKHIVRLREGRIYEFNFNDQLTKGDVEVTVLDKDKRELLKLNRIRSAGKIKPDGKNRYYIRWNFKSADGNCEVRW